MRYIKLLGISALMIVQTAESLSASFDCSKAMTPAEKAICANPDLGRLDQSVADAYRRLLSQVEEPFKRYVQAAQRSWLKSRTDPGNLAATLEVRLKELNDSNYHSHDLSFLRLMNDERPMFLLTKLPGTDLYNQWARNEWQTAPSVYTAEEYEKARNDCNEKQDCIEVVHQSYTMTAASPEILSIRKSISVDDFGAHPSNEQVNYRWWLSKAGEIEPSDIFVDKRYVGIITQAVVKYFAENFAGQYNQDDAVKIARNSSNWAISAKSLQITGQGYDFSVGRSAIEIDIPWEDFREVVAPQFMDILKGIR